MDTNEICDKSTGNADNEAGLRTMSGQAPHLIHYENALMAIVSTLGSDAWKLPPGTPVLDIESGKWVRTERGWQHLWPDETMGIHVELPGSHAPPPAPADVEAKRCVKCGIEATWSSSDCPICFGDLKPAPPPLRGRPGVIDLLRKVTGDPMAEPTPPAECPTPETDAYIGDDQDCMTEGEIALCEFNRRLERERDNAISDFRQADTAARNAIRELAKAREMIDAAKLPVDQAVVLRLIEERNEARDQRDRLADALRSIRQMTRNDERCPVCTEVYHAANAALTAPTPEGLEIAGFRITSDPTLPSGTGEIRDSNTGEILQVIKVQE